MINFKNIALAATIAAGTVFGAVTPAEAGTCWFREGYGHRANAEYCATNRRINYNGHVVFDVTDNKGTKITIVMWDDNTAELIGLIDRPIDVRTYTDRDGDTRFVLRNGAELIIRF